MHEGTWNERPGQDWWYGLAEGVVDLAPFSKLVPDNVRKIVEERKQAIIEGKLSIFPGMSDKDLRRFITSNQRWWVIFLDLGTKQKDTFYQAIFCRIDFLQRSLSMVNPRGAQGDREGF